MDERKLCLENAGSYKDNWAQFSVGVQKAREQRTRCCLTTPDAWVLQQHLVRFSKLQSVSMVATAIF